ncbi:hypothetical protein [Corynebacterium sp.]|uniref:hypothetical protein n=1 Tax=Corynebacterium sp. TaxID=1720 RepID=UPI002A91B27D|nr:hypothetical protein [Corynebacterium sp.]MDY5784607.1 hypothetical protein [Corynebacterium sp.]
MLSVPLASSSLMSQVPMLAVPSLLLAILGRSLLGTALYQGVGSTGSALSSAITDATATFPDPDAPPAEFVSLEHMVDDRYELTVYSPSMQREVKNDILLPGGVDNTEPRPTFYLMLGADGAADGFSWHGNTDYEEFFADKHVNVVTPKGSVSSMQAD